MVCWEVAAMASSWYVVKGSDNENIKYFKDETGGYVSSKWSEAQTSGTLSGLLNGTSISDEDIIYISEGTYILAQTITLKKVISIYGGFSGTEQSINDRNISSSPTILSGNNARQVLAITANANLDGLIITKGKGDFGGGISISAASPVITNCLITENTASLNGGGFYISGQSSPVITNCSITSNTSSSSGGGFDVSGRTTLELTNCSITNNSAKSDGGGFSVSGNATLNFTNCTVTANSAISKGAGIYQTHSLVTSLCTINVRNCTIAHNLNASDGSEIHNNNSTANFINSIVWNENADQAIGKSGTASAITFSYTNCALPSGITEGSNTFSLAQWDSPQSSSVTVNGVTHTVYALADNPDLLPLVAAGTSTGSPSTDQLGVTRRLPPSIGSVEGAAAYYVMKSGTGENISYIKTSGDYDAAQASVNSTLSALMKSSISGDIVHVGEGTYELSEPIVLGRRVKLLGGFDDNADGIGGKTCSSFLDGGGNSAVLSVTSDSQIDGFNIKNANDYGIEISGSPAITNCAVSGTNGEGVLISSGSPSFTNFTVISSTSNGIHISSGSPSFTNCTITGNSVGVLCEGSSTFMNCSIAGNTSNSFGASSLTNSLVYGTSSGTGTFDHCALPEGFSEGNITDSVYVSSWTPAASSREVKGVTHSVFALTDNPELDVLSGAGKADGAPAADILGTSRLSPPTIGSMEYPYDTSYLISIPESLSIAQSGWNAVTGGISAQHDSSSAGRTFTPAKKLKVSAASTNNWALKSEHDQTIAYTLKPQENGNAQTSWEFSPEEINSGTAKSFGADVEDYSSKPSGEYSDTLTFSVSIEDK